MEEINTQKYIVRVATGCADNEVPENDVEFLTLTQAVEYVNLLGDNTVYAIDSVTVHTIVHHCWEKA